jgi:predicted porin
MNKTLIAMAVAGVMAAPMAAQADATVYGKIHISIDSGDTGGQDYTTPPVTDGDPDIQDASGLWFQSNSGRIGFKGSEDLGGGLKAVWQFESNASFGSGSTSFGGRNSFLGLSGGWGTLIGGKHDTPFKSVGRWFDLFGDYVGDSRNVIQKPNGSDNWDQRPDNVIAYTSPKFGGGFDVQVAYVMDDAQPDSTATSAYGRWKSGNWLVGLGYETHDQTGTASSSDGLRAGLQWSPGAWKINGFYQTVSDAGGSSGTDSIARGLGAAFTMGKNVLKAQYYMVEDDRAGATNTDANVMAVGWDYNMSKRTTAYIAYAATSNDDNIYYCADAGGHGGEICGASQTRTTGDDPSVLSFGMIHKF